MGLLFCCYESQIATSSLFLFDKSCLIFLDPWPWQEGSYDLGSVLPSFHPSVCLSFFQAVFLELAHQLFLKLFIVLGAHMGPNVWVGQIPFRQEWPEMAKKGPKLGFLHFQENLFISFFWKCCRMKAIITLGILQKHE